MKAAVIHGPKKITCVAIFGSGPGGIMAAKSAWLRGAARVMKAQKKW